jgi:protein tyrosine/serine phosphatase
MLLITRNIYRGPRPKSYKDLQALGFTVCIDLQSGMENAFTDSQLENEDPKDFGICVINIPCSNIFPPGHRQVLAVMNVLWQISEAKKVYIHCHSGVDRIGFISALIRLIFNQWNFTPAHEEFVRLGRHWWFWWWKYNLKSWFK